MSRCLDFLAKWTRSPGPKFGRFGKTQSAAKKKPPAWTRLRPQELAPQSGGAGWSLVEFRSQKWIFHQKIYRNSSASKGLMEFMEAARVDSQHVPLLCLFET